MRIKFRPLPVLAAAAVLLAMAFLLISPARYGRCVLDGISLWAVCVLPATFPFLFLTSLFSRLPLFRRVSDRLSKGAGALFGVSGAGGCTAVLSALSGYPVGARSTLDLSEKGVIGREEVFRLACLATTTGPMFLVGAVGGGMLSRPSLGWLMLICHYLGVWTVSFVLARGKEVPRSLPLPAADSQNALYDSLYGSVLSILCVGGSIALFYAFGQMLLDVLPPMPTAAEGLVRGLLEMTGGCRAFCADPSPLSLAACCFLVTFGGVCVLVQQLAFLPRAGVKTLPFLAVKLIQALLSGGLCYLAAAILW